MKNIKIESITTNQELDQVKGGGLLLPAVQHLRATSSRSGFSGGVRVATGDVNG